ncbi:YoaK family protein [Vibrio sp. CAU 1672]|uniref:YoaK family protein n=1 Tax=Vibrio sp. CAU 1672 TaxID=3032594 RepID=UPI0023D98196|nr:YoaK family protein [Vibrio sp. CAU 1672]MDF2155370.1 YoaK family protein [Vibrio sp. CAU 1672]
MISKLPRWVEYGAFMLALLAGCVNAIGLLGFQHQAISHLSGTVTQLGNSFFNDISSTFHLMLIVVSFLVGAAFSGFFIESSALKLGRRYGVALCIEGTLLLMSLGFLIQGNVYGQYLASAACGLQNAMITTFSGAVVRTTHMTGIITDLGIMIGESLRGRQFDHRKAKLFLFIFGGFLLGGVLGAALFKSYQLHALAFPAGLAYIIAVAYWIYLFVSHRRHMTSQ